MMSHKMITIGVGLLSILMFAKIYSVMSLPIIFHPERHPNRWVLNASVIHEIMDQLDGIKKEKEEADDYESEENGSLDFDPRKELSSIETTEATLTAEVPTSSPVMSAEFSQTAEETWSRDDGITVTERPVASDDAALPVSTAVPTETEDVESMYLVKTKSSEISEPTTVLYDGASETKNDIDSLSTEEPQSQSTESTEIFTTTTAQYLESTSTVSEALVTETETPKSTDDIADVESVSEVNVSNDESTEAFTDEPAQMIMTTEQTQANGDENTTAYEENIISTTATVETTETFSSDFNTTMPTVDAQPNQNKTVSVIDGSSFFESHQSPSLSHASESSLETSQEESSTSSISDEEKKSSSIDFTHDDSI